MQGHMGGPGMMPGMQNMYDPSVGPRGKSFYLPTRHFVGMWGSPNRGTVVQTTVAGLPQCASNRVPERSL